MVLLDNLSQSLAKITHQTAANTAGVHFGDVDTGILQKTAVNTDFTELIFNEHQLLALVGLRDHLFDQGCFAGTQKAGININFHRLHLLLYSFPQDIIPPSFHKDKHIIQIFSTDFD